MTYESLQKEKGIDTDETEYTHSIIGGLSSNDGKGNENITWK